MVNKTIKPLTLDTLLSVVENSVGTTIFQTIWAEVDGEKTDVTKEGDLSCAFYVSGILSMFDLIDRVHATVKTTIKCLEEVGWEKTTELKPGVVLVWGVPQGGNFTHEHIGFYISNNEAISNIWQAKVPGRHHITFGEEGSDTYRPIIAIYAHPDLR
ncbi:MAG TPA: hypothetical protein VI752_02685 [Candidatus Paceibacterota bacterium]